MAGRPPISYPLLQAALGITAATCTVRGCSQHQTVPVCGRNAPVSSTTSRHSGWVSKAWASASAVLSSVSCSAAGTRRRSRPSRADKAMIWFLVCDSASPIRAAHAAAKLELGSNPIMLSPLHQIRVLTACIVHMATRSVWNLLAEAVQWCKRWTRRIRCCV